MPWGLAAAAVGTIAGAAISSHGAQSAADTQAAAANQANQTQLQMFNTIQGNEAPWVSTGQQANSALAQFYGLPGSGASSSTGPPSGSNVISLGGGAYGVGNSGPQVSGGGSTPAATTPDYNAILSNLPGYQFQLQQGTQATQRDLAAQGLLQSGAAGKALTTFGQGLAQNYAGQYTAGLTNLSQLGQAGAAGVASAGINAANQIGSNQIYAGNAQATGQMNAANAYGQGISGLAGIAGQYFGRQQTPTQLPFNGADLTQAQKDYASFGQPYNTGNP